MKIEGTDNSATDLRHEIDCRVSDLDAMLQDTNTLSDRMAQKVEDKIRDVLAARQTLSVMSNKMSRVKKSKSARKLGLPQFTQDQSYDTLSNKLGISQIVSVGCTDFKPLKHNFMVSPAKKQASLRDLSKSLRKPAPMINISPTKSSRRGAFSPLKSSKK
jgi:ElaB/YqjD/DUF883 family membrane-anchored ribosome-binding protein